MKKQWLVLLPSGEYSRLAGCELVQMPDEAVRILEKDGPDGFDGLVHDPEWTDELSLHTRHLDLEAVLWHGYKLSDYEDEQEG
jgi:hypothetical protein